MYANNLDELDKFLERHVLVTVFKILCAGTGVEVGRPVSSEWHQMRVT